MAFVVDVYGGGVYWMLLQDNDSVVIDADNCYNVCKIIVVVANFIVVVDYCYYYFDVVAVVNKNDDYEDVDDDDYNFNTHNVDNVDIDFGIDSDCSHSSSNNLHIIDDAVDVDGNIVVVAAVYSYNNCNIAVVVEFVNFFPINNNYNCVLLPYVYMACDSVIVDDDNADNCFCYCVVLLVYP